MRLLLHTLTACLAASALVAQEAKPTLLLAMQPLATVIATTGVDGRVHFVDWRERGVRIPLADPAEECAFGTDAGGRTLAILAGGLRESLELYLVAADGTVLCRVPTEGGRRLPRSFQHGSGSLPSLDGQGLAVFAYEKGDRVVIAAIDLEGRVLATHECSRDTSEYRVEVDARGDRVRIQVGQGPAGFELPHPTAPRLAIDSRVIDFGRLKPGAEATRSLRLENLGGRPLVLELAVDRPEFRIHGAARVELPPAGSLLVGLAFTAGTPGARRARLLLHSPSFDRPRELVLTGEVEAVRPASQPAPQPAPPPTSYPDSHERPAAPAPAPGSATPSRPAPQVTLRRHAGRIEIRGPGRRPVLVVVALAAVPTGVAIRGLTSWRASLSAAGELSFPEAALGEIRQPIVVEVLLEDVTGSWLRAAELRIEPPR